MKKENHGLPGPTKEVVAKEAVVDAAWDRGGIPLPSTAHPAARRQRRCYRYRAHDAPGIFIRPRLARP